MGSFTLHSNSGRECLHCVASGMVDTKAEDLLLCDITLSGKHWAVSDSYPLRFDAQQVPLSTSALRSAESFLRDWLELPLERQARSPLESEFHLGGHLMLVFGRREDVIDDRHEVVTVHICLGRVRIEGVYVTDQSCIRIFCDGIREVLGDSDRALK